MLTLKVFSKNENMPVIGFVFFCLLFYKLFVYRQTNEDSETLVANIETIEVPNNFSAQTTFLKLKSNQIWTCFLLFTIVEISCLQVNKRGQQTL